MKTASQPSLTITICTYNRAELLASCLESLATQTVPADQFCILVVNNNSSDNTQSIVAQFQKRLPRLNYCLETQQGLSHARNRALKESDTDWVAYLDDDALARPNWVEHIISMIQNQPYDAFGGSYLPWYRDGKVEWFLDRYASDRAWMPYTEIAELEERCFSGGNAVYKRSAALEAGSFPTHLGMQGDKLGYGEENALQYALRKLGYRIGYDPDMNIEHLVPLNKQKLSWFLERRCREGQTHLWQGKQANSPKRIASLLMHFILLDIRNLFRGLWRLLKGEYRWQNLYIDTVPEWCFQWHVLLSIPRRRSDVG